MGDYLFYLPIDMCRALQGVGYTPETKFLYDTKKNNQIVFSTLLSKGSAKDRYVPAFTAGELEFSKSYFFLDFYGVSYLFERIDTNIETLLHYSEKISFDGNHILKANSEIELRAKAVLYHSLMDNLKCSIALPDDRFEKNIGETKLDFVKSKLLSLFKLGAFNAHHNFLHYFTEWIPATKHADYTSCEGYFLVNYTDYTLERLNTIVCDSVSVGVYSTLFSTPNGFGVEMRDVHRFVYISL